MGTTPWGMSYPLPVASVDPGVEQVLVKVLVQLIVIILAARVLSMTFRKIGQPAVVGEMIGGLMLGPSFFGQFFPNAFRALFDPSLESVFKILSQLGLILLLFLIGLEFDFSHIKQRGRAAWAVSWTGIALPFVLGYLLGGILHRHMHLTVDLLGLRLFMGTAMSITAIPVLGRIMMELNLTRSATGVITITAAALDDASGWILLATVSALVQTGFDLAKTVSMLLLTVAFVLFMIYAAKPILHRGIVFALRRSGGDLGLNSLAALFAVLHLCALATNLIGIFSVFGAFILGAVLSDERDFKESVAKNFNKFVTVFFLPIFFTFTGLRTDVGSLDSTLHWFFAGLVILVAIAGKFGGCTVAAKLGGFPWRESACIGVMMNTRGLMELIVINVGYELGVLPRSVFVMLVLMAMATTIMTTPVLLRLLRKTDMQPLVDVSQFSRARRRRWVAQAKSS